MAVELPRIEERSRAVSGVVDGDKGRIVTPHWRMGWDGIDGHVSEGNGDRFVGTIRTRRLPKPGWRLEVRAVPEGDGDPFKTIVPETVEADGDELLGSQCLGLRFPAEVDPSPSPASTPRISGSLGRSGCRGCHRDARPLLRNRVPGGARPIIRGS